MRRLALAFGLLIIAVVWFGPLVGRWRESFAAGMVAHMSIVAIAAPLIAIGLPRRLRPGTSMPIGLPLVASLLELIAVWGWHAPALRSVVKESLAATVAEQASFLLVGIMLWSTSLAASGARTHAATGTAALLLTSIHMTLLGALLSLSPRPLYGAVEVSCFGVVLDAGQDQQLGGVIMLLAGAVVYLAGGLWLARGILAETGTAAPRAAVHEKVGR